MLPIPVKKYCCGGNYAVLVETLWPMKKRGKKFFMAIYQCKTCGEFSLRGDSQTKEWNTFVEVLDKQKVKSFRREKETKHGYSNKS